MHRTIFFLFSFVFSYDDTLLLVLLSRRSRQRELLSAPMVVSICSFVCLSVCLSVAKMRKRDFLKN